MIELILSIMMSMSSITMFDFFCNVTKGSNTVMVQCCVAYSCQYKVCNFETKNCWEGNQE